MNQNKPTENYQKLLLKDVCICCSVSQTPIHASESVTRKCTTAKWTLTIDMLFPNSWNQLSWTLLGACRKLYKTPIKLSVKKTNLPTKSNKRYRKNKSLNSDAWTQCVKRWVVSVAIPRLGDRKPNILAMLGLWFGEVANFFQVTIHHKDNTRNAELALLNVVLKYKYICGCWVGEDGS